MNEVEVHESAEVPWYFYVNTANCGGVNVSLPVKGVLSDDPTSPGDLKENVGFKNATMRHLDPNMIFEAAYTGGVMDLALTYACLGRLQPKFSFNVLSRSNRWNVSDVRALIHDANSSTGGALDVEGIRISDGDTYAECGMTLH